MNNAREPEKRFAEIPVTLMPENRKATVQRIETVVNDIKKQLSSNTYPKLTEVLTNLNDIPNSVPFHDGHHFGSREASSDPDEADEEMPEQTRKYETMPVQDPQPSTSSSQPSQRNGTATIDLRLKRSRNKMTLMMIVMARIHQLLITSSTRTRRSLYYELQNGSSVHLVPSQRYLDDVISDVASLLERAPWELGEHITLVPPLTARWLANIEILAIGLLPTGKGLVFGELRFTFSGTDTVDCSAPGGTSIPPNVFDVTSMSSVARYVLVVEKDSVFQKLLGENCPQILDCILVTGKGYPDVATRMLVRLLWKELKLPVYAFVDADPHGFEIMCVYRFGSAARSRQREELACPGIRWLGVHPSELGALGVALEPLTKSDRVKLESLEKRSYLDSGLLKQLECMRRGKVEIETLIGFSQGFLTDVYLPSKIEAMQYL